MRVAVLWVLLKVHVVHVATATNSFPFHGLDMFRDGLPQVDRAKVITITTPALVDAESCRVEFLSIRREHGLQWGKRFEAPSFLMRWDNTATFPLRYDVRGDARIDVARSAVGVLSPDFDFAMVTVSYSYPSASLTASVMQTEAEESSSADCSELDLVRSVDG